MSKADDRELGSLHGVLARTLKESIEKGEQYINKDGELAVKPASASLLSVARQFLKDNHIESTRGNKDMSALEQAMEDMANMPYPGESDSDYQ
jgi:hypothetical protein